VNGTGGAHLCSSVDAGACGPASLAAFTATAPPPALAQQACTSTQLQNIYNDCLNGGTCTESGVGDPAFGCFSCIFTHQTDSTWGPIVLSPESIANINLGGCLTLLEPCNAPCGATFEQDLQCEEAACGAACASTETTSLTDLNNCIAAIDSCDPGGCALYSNGTSCVTEITGAGHPGSVCFASPGNFEAAFLTVSGVFCGG
jgi:hypothetical protein